MVSNCTNISCLVHPVDEDMRGSGKYQRESIDLFFTTNFKMKRDVLKWLLEEQKTKNIGIDEITDYSRKYLLDNRKEDVIGMMADHSIRDPKVHRMFGFTLISFINYCKKLGFDVDKNKFYQLEDKQIDQFCFHPSMFTVKNDIVNIDYPFALGNWRIKYGDKLKRYVGSRLSRIVLSRSDTKFTYYMNFYHYLDNKPSNRFMETSKLIQGEKINSIMG